MSYSSVPSKNYRDSRETFADLAQLRAGVRHTFPLFGGGSMSIQPIGGESGHAHVFFRESPQGTPSGSRVFTPAEIAGLAAERMPLNHAGRVALGPSISRDGATTPAEMLDLMRKDMKEDPKEADPKASHPESVQSPAEADLFKRLNTPKLVKSTLEQVFAGGKISPGDLMDVTYRDKAETMPTRETVYYINAHGQPILHATFRYFYSGKGQLYLLLSSSAESIKSSTFRRVSIDQSLKSTSFSAGLFLGAGGPGKISSGPKAGDPVSSMGNPMGSSFKFDASYSKTHFRLRLEAELKVQEEIGRFINEKILIPIS